GVTRGVGRRAGVPRRLPRSVAEARIRESSVLAADISGGDQHRRRDLALNLQMILLRVTVFVIRVVAEGVGGIPWVGRRQRIRKPATLLLNDVGPRATREVGAGVRRAGEGSGVGPDRQFQVVLRVLAPGRDGVPVKPVAGA